MHLENCVKLMYMPIAIWRVAGKSPLCKPKTRETLAALIFLERLGYQFVLV